MLQFKLPAAHFVRIPAGGAQGFTPFLLLERAPIFGQKNCKGLQYSPRAIYSCGEGGDGRKEPTSQLHT